MFLASFYEEYWETGCLLHLLQSWDDPNPSLLNQREPGAQQQRYVTLANDRPVRLHGMKVMIIKYVQNILRQSTTACYEYGTNTLM